MHTRLNVPHFKQEKWYTCGPACLRMLLAYFDVIVSEVELEEACGTTELGTTPIQISGGAYKFGMDALAIRNADIEDLKTNLEKGLPIIVLIDPSHIYGGIAGFGHFILIVGMENNEVIYHDPGISDGDFRRCEVEKFLNAWNIFKNWMITCKRR